MSSELPLAVVFTPVQPNAAALNLVTRRVPLLGETFQSRADNGVLVVARKLALTVLVPSAPPAM